MDDRTAQLLDLLRKRSIASAAEIGQALGISQPTISRLLQAQHQIVAIGQGRRRRYGLARDIGRIGSRWPLYRIDARGRALRLGELTALYGGSFHLNAQQALPALMHDEFRDGLFPGVPWFLDDQRPQGFLGRAFARQVGPIIGAPADPTLWRADDIVLALLNHGSGLAGDLVLGEASLRRALAEQLDNPGIVDADLREQVYPQLAHAVLAGDSVGSSAAGEQPKFVCRVAEGSVVRHVIVKFSDTAAHPAGRRWGDLLWCEHLAGAVLRDHHLPAAHSQIIIAGGRTFLESRRFDREPGGGRRGFISLAALDAAFHGHGRIDWWRYASQLLAEGWLNTRDADRLAVTAWFGELIGNTDMHLGNAALELADTRPFALCPAYDMLPMALRPAASGEVVERGLTITLPTPEERVHWLAAAEMAEDFWRRVQLQAAVSSGFRAMSARIGESLAAAIAVVR